MGNNSKIQLRKWAIDLSEFWGLFSECDSIKENGDYPFKKNDIPLWHEDLGIATRIDDRFDKHFPRVIQLATWAMNPKEGEKNGPGMIGEKCENDILKLREQLSEILLDFFEKVTKEIIANEISDVSVSVEKEDIKEITAHLVCMVALYHDIGKRISVARHPEEGYFYLKNVIDEETKKNLKEKVCNIEIHPPIKRALEIKIIDKLKAEIWDVFLMVIRYHDSPGVLGTGEASLGLLVDSLSYHTKSIEKQELILMIMGFTNIVDSSASIRPRGPQLGDTGGINLEIIKNVLDDLALFRYVLRKKASQKLGYIISQNDDPFEFYYVDKMKLEEEIFRVEKAEYRTVGRIERLLKERAPDELKSKIEKDVIREAMVSTVGRTNIQEFCRRLAAVVKLEYMLNFIEWIVKYPEKIWDGIVNGEHIRKLPEHVSKWERDINVERIVDDQRNDGEIKKAREIAKALLEHIVYSALRTLMSNVFCEAIDQGFKMWGGKTYGLDKGKLKKKVESFFKARIDDIRHKELKNICEKERLLNWIPEEYQSQEPEMRLDFVEITAVLACLGHYSAKGNNIKDYLDKEKEKIEKNYDNRIKSAANEVRSWGASTFLERDELKHLAITFGSIFERYDPVIPIEKQVDLKQWFSDTDLIKHYLSIDPKFMATHVIALLWQIVQKYPPQRKHPDSELSRMGVSMRRLTDPAEFAEKIVPLIVASGTPSHAYTWIEEEVTIWHYS